MERRLACICVREKAYVITGKSSCYVLSRGCIQSGGAACLAIPMRVRVSFCLDSSVSEVTGHGRHQSPRGPGGRRRLCATSRALLTWLLRLACVDAALWALYAALTALQPASRRACNAAYAAWLLALNLLLLLALAAADALCRALDPSLNHALYPTLTQELDPAPRQTCAPAVRRVAVQVPQKVLLTVADEQKGSCDMVQQRPSGLLEALGNHMLAVFLLANMLTGAVNLSMNTLVVGGAAARCILVMYAGLLCGAAVLLQHGGVRLRLS